MTDPKQIAELRGMFRIKRSDRLGIYHHLANEAGSARRAGEESRAEGLCLSARRFSRPWKHEINDRRALLAEPADGGEG
jgi:hypothetical protein